jgi:hypothetical protein
MQLHTVYRFALAALATWRLSYLIAREDGPRNWLATWRRLSRPVCGRLFDCVKCISLWIAAPMAWFVGGTPAELAVTWLALSGVAALIDELTRPPFEWHELPGDRVAAGSPSNETTHANETTND